jgi:hypothetical protein
VQEWPVRNTLHPQGHQVGDGLPGTIAIELTTGRETTPRRDDLEIDDLRRHHALA